MSRPREGAESGSSDSDEDDFVESGSSDSDEDDFVDSGSSDAGERDCACKVQAFHDDFQIEWSDFKSKFFARAKAFDDEFHKNWNLFNSQSLAMAPAFDDDFPANWSDFGPTFRHKSEGSAQAFDDDLRDVITDFSEMELQPSSNTDRKRIRSDIESGKAYAVSGSNVRGRVIVFSNREFVKKSLSVRHGTEHDEKNLTYFFGGTLGFETVVYINLTAKDMKQKLRRETKKNLKGFDVFILFFLSHGINGEIYGVDGKTFKTKNIIQLLDGKHCPQLVGKPKLIFIQACRTDPQNMEASADMDGLAYAQELDSLDYLDDEVKDNFMKLSAVSSDGRREKKSCHARKDMAVFFSTVSGYPSYRQRHRGSYFILSLLNVFARKAHTDDVVSMMTEVLRLVHDYFEEKQLGEQNSSLLRKIYLKI